MSDKDRIAPPGSLWVCLACGKWAEDKYGMQGDHSRGWDESCMLNSVLAKRSELNYHDDGRVISIGKKE
jgi:hypothetical protein